jgi:hypothetical protein
MIETETPVSIDRSILKRDTRSKLVKAQNQFNGAPTKHVCACPFGCNFERGLDDHGYCRHMVGFSADGVTFEPVIRDPKAGRRNTKMPTKDVQEMTGIDEAGQPIYETVKVGTPVKLSPGDVLVRVTISYRVYRDVDKIGRAPDIKVDTATLTQSLQDSEVDRQLHAQMPQRSPSNLEDSLIVK